MPDRFSSIQKTANIIQGYAYQKSTGATNSTLSQFNAFLYNAKLMAQKPDADEKTKNFYNTLAAYSTLCKQIGENYGNLSKEQLAENLREASKTADVISESMAKLEKKTPEFTAWDNNWTHKGEFNDGGIILANAGPKKSAAKWIDDIKAQAKAGKTVTADQLAKIFAARQLADAKRGKRKNIDSKQLTEAEIDAQAYKVRNSKEFQDFVKQNEPIKYDQLSGGHGGILEQKFEDYLVKVKPENEMDYDAHGRYRQRINDNIKSTAEFEVLDNPFKKKEEPKAEEPQFKEGSPRYQYKSYSDYFTKNKNNFDGTVTPEYHAAKMVAAHFLMTKDHNAPFNEKEFNETTREFMKDPAFKLVCKIPGNLEKICKGDMEGFYKEADDLKLAADALFVEHYDRDLGKEVSEFYPKGFLAPSLERLREQSETDPKLKTIVDNVDKLYEPGEHDSQEVIKAISSLTDYQDKYGHLNMGQEAKNVNDTVRLLHEIVKGRSISGIVDTQIDKLNKSRGFEEGHRNFLTVDKIAAEGERERIRLHEEIKDDLFNEGVQKEFNRTNSEIDLNESVDSNNQNKNNGPVNFM